MNAQRALGIAGLWGALLTLVILAMSVLMRLGTHLEDGTAVSTLPGMVEQGARIAHRVAAMGVGVLAALALVTVWRGEGAARASARAVWIVVALTLLLALVGRYTPGYRDDLVTVTNVAGGIALLAAFWAVRLRDRADSSDALAWGALALLLVLAGLGAAADLAAMRGTRAFGPLHLWIATIFSALALGSAWRQRSRRALAAAVALLTVSQLALGILLLAGRVARPLALGWLHAMVACALAVLLVGLALRGVRR